MHFDHMWMDQRDCPCGTIHRAHAMHPVQVLLHIETNCNIVMLLLCTQEIHLLAHV